MLIQGRLVPFIGLVVISLVTYILTKMEWTPTIRKIPAFDAIEEAIGRATELGRPVHITPGTGSLNTQSTGPSLLAGLATVSYTAGICAKLDTPLLVSIGSSDAIALTQSLIKQAYMLEGNPEGYDDNIIHYFPGRDTGVYTLAFTNSVMGLMSREKPAANIMIGPFYGEQIALCEIAAREGAITIGGTQAITQMAVFAAISDYVVIGEEIFAAGAYISQDPIQLKTIAGGDFGKVSAIGLIILGVLLKMIGFDLSSLFGV